MLPVPPDALTGHTEPRITITPSQAMLILFKNNPAKIEKYGALYLKGVFSQTDAEQFEALLRDPALKPYQITYAHEKINNDPSRRYFESHLSYASLSGALGKIELEDLKKHFAFIRDFNPEVYDEWDRGIILAEDFNLSALQAQLHQLPEENRPSLHLLEYADAISALKESALYEGFSALEKEKLQLILISIYISFIQCSRLNNDFPFE